MPSPAHQFDCRTPWTKHSHSFAQRQGLALFSSLAHECEDYGIFHSSLVLRKKFGHTCITTRLDTLEPKSPKPLRVPYHENVTFHHCIVGLSVDRCSRLEQRR